MTYSPGDDESIGMEVSPPITHMFQWLSAFAYPSGHGLGCDIPECTIQSVSIACYLGSQGDSPSEAYSNLWNLLVLLLTSGWSELVREAVQRLHQDCPGFVIGLLDIWLLWP